MGKDYIEKTLRRYNFTRPSFFEGMARVLDLGSTIRLYKGGFGPEADAKAIASDWEAIGQDLKSVIGEYEARRSKSK